MSTEENRKFHRAKKRVNDLKGFYQNLLSYIVIIPFLILVNYMTYWEFKWFWFSAIGWGIGVVIHAFVIFSVGTDWEKRKIQEFMEKDNY